MTMKLFQKKKDNKGFSLVELIVVVAIMAVLLGVLVPTLVRHVESSKLSKDKSALDELKNAVEIALSKEKFSGIEFSDAEVWANEKCDWYDKLKDVEGMDTAFLDEVSDNLGETKSIDITSKLKKDKKTSIKVTVENDHCKIVVTSEKGGDYAFNIPE